MQGISTFARSGARRAAWVVAALGLFSAGEPANAGRMDAAQARMPLVAVARLEPAAGQHVYGVVTFLEAEGGVRVLADVGGLTPGRHGLCIHEKADLSAPDFSSAGGHFNPRNYPHAGRESPVRHAGDLGNLEAGPDGLAHLDYVDPNLALAGPHAIVGLPVIVHLAPDDAKTQPGGNAGPGIAGGLITLRQ